MNKKSVFVLCLSVFAIAALIFSGAPRLVGAQPGDATDPLVTRRYVDNRINELNAQIARLEAIIAGGQVAPQAPQPPAGHDAPPLGGQGTPPLVTAPAGQVDRSAATVVPFRVYYASQGQRIFFDAGAEFVLRSGEATAVTGQHGFVDVTAGRDVLNGDPVYINHLLLVPAADGRGLHFHVGGWIMIRGNYQVAD